jgi:hypothetical protein
MMAAIALVAIDCVAIRTPLLGRTVTEAMLLLGGLPMANILAAGLLTLLRDRSWRRVYRPWLVGFEVVGWTALCLYASCAYYHPDALRETVVHTASPLRALASHAFIAVIMAALALPHIALALLGGWLNRKYAIGVTIIDLFQRELTTAA